MQYPLNIMISAVMAATLLGAGGAGAEETHGAVSKCDQITNPDYMMARADRVWLGKVTNVSSYATIGSAFSVTRKGTYRVKPVTALKGPLPRWRRREKWSETFTDDGQTFGSPPTAGQRYFVAEWDGDPYYVEIECLKSIPQPVEHVPAGSEPKLSELIALGKAQRLAGNLRTAYGFISRGWDQIRVASIAHERRYGLRTGYLDVEWIESFLERGQVLRAMGDRSSCYDFRFADLLLKDRKREGQKVAQIRADVDAALAEGVCEGIPVRQPAR